MTRIDDGCRLTTNPDLTTMRVEDELIVLNEEREQVHKLNESAAFVFEMCRSGYTVSSVKTDFLARYEVDRKIVERDVDSLLETFLDLGLVSCKKMPSSDLDHTI